ncbi:MAG: hypothetical protein KC503_34550 [Myxococcales bacterium]|nr:hypothetical protein [Myxococcales bacterium]
MDHRLHFTRVMISTPQIQRPSREVAAQQRRRLIAAAARRARGMTQSAARSTSALGWLSSWDSLTYFVMPVIAGGLLAPLAVWYLPRHIGLPLALSFALWPLLALCIGSLGASLGERRERAWRGSLPFSLRGHRAALAGSIEPQTITYTFAGLAPSKVELREALDRAGFRGVGLLVVGERARIELRYDKRASHDQRAYFVAVRRLVDDVACPLHERHAIAEVSVV